MDFRFLIFNWQYFCFIIPMNLACRNGEKVHLSEMHRRIVVLEQHFLFEFGMENDIVQWSLIPVRTQHNGKNALVLGGRFLPKFAVRLFFLISQLWGFYENFLFCRICKIVLAKSYVRVLAKLFIKDSYSFSGSRCLKPPMCLFKDTETFRRKLNFNSNYLTG